MTYSKTIMKSLFSGELTGYELVDGSTKEEVLIVIPWLGWGTAKWAHKTTQLISDGPHDDGVKFE